MYIAYGCRSSASRPGSAGPDNRAHILYGSVMHSGQAVWRQKRRAVRRLFAVGDWILRYYSPANKCKLDSAWVGPYLVVSLAGWALGIQLHPDSPIILVHCQDFHAPVA